MAREGIVCIFSQPRAIEGYFEGGYEVIRMFFEYSLKLINIVGIFLNVGEYFKNILWTNFLDCILF